jgi:hypothetical protein
MKKNVYAAVILGAIVLLCSCKSMSMLSGNYGNFRPDLVAEADFLKPVVNPNYNYYIYGPDLFPDVLLGLDKKYKLEPGAFKPVSLSPATMKVLVGDMQHKAISQTDILRGFYIVDEKGSIIGEWYSPFFFNSSVALKDGIAAIAAPDFPNRPFGKTNSDSDMN